jgi:cobaltochelatase CobS
MARSARKPVDHLADENKTSIEVPDSNVSMIGLREAHPEAPGPGIAQRYRFSADVVQEIAVAVKLAENVLLTGPTGCGKTSLPTALASLLGRPLVRFNMNGETRVSNLVGMNKPSAKDGVLTLIFTLGMLARAMREGWWVILDEIEAALPSVLFVLQPVLEAGNRSLQIPETGEVIEAHEEFRVFATGNTLGYRASARARYSGTNMMNAAFIDRFGVIIDCRYPTKEEERERVLCHCPDVDDDFIEGICRVADALRKDDAFRSDFSTRRCIQWAKLLPHFDYDELRTAEMAWIRKLESPTDAKVAREVCKRKFGYEEGGE